MKDVYIIKWECDWEIKIMWAIELTKEQFEKRDEDKKLEKIWNELLQANFESGYWIETLEDWIAKREYHKEEVARCSRKINSIKTMQRKKSK